MWKISLAALILLGAGCVPSFDAFFGTDSEEAQREAELEELFEEYE